MKRRAFSTKYISDAFIKANRTGFQDWANEVVKGYNKIVANWSAESKPRFVPVVRYQTDTKRTYVYIHIKGDDIQVGRFESVDFGKKRSGTVERKNVSATMVKVPHGVTQRHQGYKESNDAYDEYVREFKKQYTVRNPMYTFRGFPMRVHDPKTNTNVRYGGPGTYKPSERYTKGSGDFGDWQYIPIIREYDQGDILPRDFTKSLYFLTLGKTSPGREIWNEKIVHWRNTVERSYARGVRAANKRAASANQS